MDINEYREFYINEITNTAISESIHPCDAFINDVADMLINDLSAINDLTLCAYEWKNGNRQYKSMKIDAINVDVVTNTLNLLIADFNSGEIQTITNEIKNNYTQWMLNFFENVLKHFFSQTEQSAVYSQEAFNVLRNISSIDKLHLFIISTNKISERVKDLKLEPYSFQGKTYNVKLDIFDFNAIYQAKASNFVKEDLIIDVQNYGIDGIPCIRANIQTDNYDSYLAIVPGEFLADIYDECGPRLLESNVRSFLSFRGGINKGIRGTILNCPDKFFTYNNGISATAKSIECKVVPGQGLIITNFVGLQIINGGQTTASLASTRIKDKASLRQIFVQMKLTVVKEDDPEFVRNIAKFANSQNKVTSADLNSNHPFYTEIEDFSRKIYTPAANGKTYQELWFFERARGQYEQPMIKMTTKKQREDYQRIRPKDKKFTKTDLAKYVNSANMQPYYVSWGADVNATRFQEQLEKSWDKDNTIYNEFYYKELIGMAILYKSLERIISNQEWYQANKAYRPQIVTYTFAKLVYEANKLKLHIDYIDIWDKQAISPVMEIELAKIAKLAFTNIYDSGGVANIGTYCKQKTCWEMLQQRDYELSEDIKEILISDEERKVNQTRSKKEQRFNNAVNYEIEIFNKGQDYWQQLITKGLEQGVLNYTELSLLDAAKKSCITARIVSDKQAKIIMEIVEKLKEVGIE